MKSKQKQINTISLFSGIGAYEKGGANLGLNMNILHFCEINKFAATAYSAIHNVPEEKNLGDISLIDTSKLPKCDLVTYSFPCFVAGTLVLTDKGYKKIEDIEIGDKVLTHNNQYKEVILPMEKYTNKIYRISSMCSEDLLVTEEHPFYVREKINNEFSKPKWVLTKNLTKNHYLGIAINQESKTPNINSVLSDKFRFEEFWWLVGKYIKDGEIDENGLIKIPCLNYANFEVTDILERFNFDYRIIKGKKYSITCINSKELLSFLKKFGKDNESKKLNETIFDLPKEELRAFIRGYTFLSYHSNGDYTLNSSNSRDLVYGIGQCIAKAYNIPYSISLKKESEIYLLKNKEKKIKETYIITFKMNSCKNSNAFFEDNYLWFPINSILTEDYDDMVYNMEVEEDNSYTVNNIIVHNCQSISCAGRREGIIKGKTKSGLVYEALDVIEATSPTVAIMENVKNLVGKKFINDFNNLLQILDELGYNNYWKVLNAKDYGLPQNRKRVFLISIKKEVDTGYNFPEPIELKLKSIDLIDKEDKNVYWVNEKSDASVYASLLTKNPNDIEGVAKNPKTREYHNFKEISDCLLAHDAQTKNLVQFYNKDGKKVVRRMTPAESFKFMGFDNQDYYKAKKKLEEKYYNGKSRSDSQIYRMAGNSIAVNCIQAILENLYIK